MVKVIDYKLRQTEEGKEFFVLIVQGGIEMVQSKSGKFYATAKKASLPTTFDELTCQSLIGEELEGKIAKVECEPYEVTKESTGEIITLNHRYTYISEKAEIQEFKADVNTFSSNGVMSPV